jgi:hypothetical protein
MRDYFRDPLGWLMDALPWPLRKLIAACRLRLMPWRVPNSLRIFAWRRADAQTVAALRRLEGLDD